MNVPRMNGHRARPALLLGAALLACGGIGAETPGVVPPTGDARAGDTSSSEILVHGVGEWPLHRNDGFAIRFPPGWEISRGCGSSMARHWRATSPAVVLNVGLVGAATTADWLQATDVINLVAQARSRRSEPVLIGTRRFHVLDLNGGPDQTQLLCTADSAADGTRGVIRVHLFRSRGASPDVAAQAEASERALVVAIASTFNFAPRMPRFPPADGVEALRVGESAHIAWSPGDPDSTTKVRISLEDVRYESGHPRGSATIAEVPNTGRYVWTVPDSLGSLLPLGRNWSDYEMCLRLVAGDDAPCSDSRRIVITGPWEECRLPDAPWKAYRDDQIGFTIRCPEYLVCSQTKSPGDTLVEIRPRRESELECLRDTYTHFYLTIAAARDSRAIGDCLQERVSGNSRPGKIDESSGIRMVVPGEIRLGKVVYTVDDVSDVATGHWYYTRSYRTIRKDSCIEIGLHVFGTAAGPYYRTNTLYRLISKEPLIQDLEQVIATIEFGG